MIYIKVISRYNINNITISNISQYQFDKDMEQFNVTNRQRLPITDKSELIWLGGLGGHGIYIKCAYDRDVINNTIRWFETNDDSIWPHIDDSLCPYIIKHLKILLLKCNAKSYNLDEQEIDELMYEEAVKEYNIKLEEINELCN